MAILEFLTKKEACSICGEEKRSLIGGLKKLSDGKICKDCRQKLSPYYDISGKSVGDVQAHLAYREKNKEALARFSPLQTISGHKQVLLIDEASQKFIIASGTDYRSENPDVFDFSSIASLEPVITRSSNVYGLYDKDSHSVDADSRETFQFTLSYDFTVTIDFSIDWMKPLTFCIEKNVKERDFALCCAYAGRLADLCSLLGKKEAVPAYQERREARNKLLNNFHVTQSVNFADGCVMVDANQKCFVIGPSADPKKASDVFMLSDIVSMDIKEIPCSRELKTKDENGRNVSYDPPRYEKSVWYSCVIYLKNSWAEQIDLHITPYAVSVNEGLQYRQTIARLNLMLGQDTSQFSDVYTEILFDRIRKLNGGL